MPSTQSGGKAAGVTLAVGGNLLIAVALNLTKHAHNLNQRSRVPRPYVHLPLWWLGCATTLTGELGNFAAYGFAEASVVAPLGAVCVLGNAFIAALLLGEGLRLSDLLGCALCIAGGCTIVSSTPPAPAVTDISVFIANVQDARFVMYIALLSAVVSLMLGFQDEYAHKHVGYYVLLCSLIGSVTVMACKGVSTFLTMWMCCGASAPFAEPVFYLLMLLIATTGMLQLRYLNAAMEKFGNTETVPVYYVLFTISTIVGSAVLYHDFVDEDRQAVSAFCGGCILTFAGVKLLTNRGGARSVACKAKSQTERAAPLLEDIPEHSHQTDIPLEDLYQPLEPPKCDISPSFMHQPMGMSSEMLRRTFSRGSGCSSSPATSHSAAAGTQRSTFSSPPMGGSPGADIAPGVDIEGARRETL
mmetsp:Transcript_39929/g.93252  ORF Transcript_39929/g.93252 Transcript_39929/m.93252 type:complete len:415 (-) Transcript_39929:76-1320(-)